MIAGLLFIVILINTENHPKMDAVVSIGSGCVLCDCKYFPAEVVTVTHFRE